MDTVLTVKKRAELIPTASTSKVYPNYDIPNVAQLLKRVRSLSYAEPNAERLDFPSVGKLVDDNPRYFDKFTTDDEIVWLHLVKLTPKIACLTLCYKASLHCRKFGR